MFLDFRMKPLKPYLTLILFVAALGLWAALIFLALPALAPYHAQALGYGGLALVLTLHSSLTHEAVHGNICKPRWLNDALMRVNIGLFYPYDRYNTTHRQHHICEALGHPHDDPESFYYAKADWEKSPRPLQAMARFQSTMAGRLALGWLLGLGRLYAGDAGAIWRGDRVLARQWALHVLFTLPIFVVLWAAPALSLGSYMAFAVLPSLMLLSVRSYIEHRVDDEAMGRSVIVESNTFWRLLFLNNNFHAIHHEHPSLPWLDIPNHYKTHKLDWHQKAQGYVFSGYGAVLARYGLHLPRWFQPPVYESHNDQPQP
jgi:fatty acid desaturase